MTFFYYESKFIFGGKGGGAGGRGEAIVSDLFLQRIQI